MSFSTSTSIHLAQGNLLASKSQTLVNTVNCVGVMGKGIALAFKRKYPEMFKDYVKRCHLGEVKLGQPYVYPVHDHLIVNFPTKDHWRSVSRLGDIEDGLDYLQAHLEEWGITSIAVPPLGCGNGQLEWSVVGPTLHRHLKTFNIPVELYAPHEIEAGQVQLALLDHPNQEKNTRPVEGEPPKVEVSALALVEILARIEAEPYHWPVGRIMFQKLAYFATMAGLPTNLEYEANNFGPYARDLSRMVARLQNNGLVQERRDGQVIETLVGKTFQDARESYGKQLAEWESIISRVTDLMIRFNSRRAEVAGSVHFVASALKKRDGVAPTAAEVIDGVLEWKIRRTPPLDPAIIARSVVELAAQRWVDVIPDETVEEAVNEIYAC